MSRGPGKWQKAILERLETEPWFYLADLLPEGASRSSYTALFRAAKVLAQHGKIERWEKWRCITMQTPQSNYRDWLQVEMPHIAVARPEVDLTIELEEYIKGQLYAKPSKRLSVD